MNEKLLELLEELYFEANEEYLAVMENYQESKDNINLLIAALFISYAKEGVLDYRTLLSNGSLDKLKLDVLTEIQKNIEFESVNLKRVLQKSFKETYEIYTDLDFLETTDITDEFVNENVEFDWSGIQYPERILNNQSALFNTLWTTLIIGIQNNESIDQITSKISKHFNSKANHSLNLMETEVARVIGDAANDIYKRSNLGKVEYISALEANTCEECATLHGNIYSFDDTSRPMLPRHNKCKCIYLPVN
ncbi:minor capsid protein [Bacillus infantis]|uniref:minor capsid protein n=1 Tax=Bacillus infantis TaxID=324767 RepID=UPI003CEA9E50